MSSHQPRGQPRQARQSLPTIPPRCPPELIGTQAYRRREEEIAQITRLRDQAAAEEHRREEEEYRQALAAIPPLDPDLRGTSAYARRQEMRREAALRRGYSFNEDMGTYGQPQQPQQLAGDFANFRPPSRTDRGGSADIRDSAGFARRDEYATQEQRRQRWNERGVTREWEYTQEQREELMREARRLQGVPQRFYNGGGGF